MLKAMIELTISPSFSFNALHAFLLEQFAWVMTSSMSCETSAISVPHIAPSGQSHLLLKATVVNLTLLLIVIVVLLAFYGGGSLALARCSFAGRVGSSALLFGSSELLSSGRLRLGVEVFDLGFAEDTSMASAGYPVTSQGLRRAFAARLHDRRRKRPNSHPGVAAWALVDVWVADDQKHTLWSPQRDSCDTLDMFQAKLADGFSCLLLVAGMDGDRGAGWDGSCSTLASATFSSTR